MKIKANEPIEFREKSKWWWTICRVLVVSMLPEFLTAFVPFPLEGQPPPAFLIVPCVIFQYIAVHLQ
ncbi:MAG: hypothetical protein AXA67_08410 [Methylothermaceae bacteria B42]|nr:MAG: hypothetical protein AXA67_08410 [Methylothermaceae bacteria B42]